MTNRECTKLSKKLSCARASLTNAEEQIQYAQFVLMDTLTTNKENSCSVESLESVMEGISKAFEYAKKKKNNLQDLQHIMIKELEYRTHKHIDYLVDADNNVDDMRMEKMTDIFNLLIEVNNV